MKERDYASSIDFLKRFFQYTVEDVELRSFEDQAGGAGKSVFGREPDRIERFLQKYDQPGRGMYFGTCTRAGGANRGRREDCRELSSLWLDIDVYETGHTKEQAVAALEGFSHPPTIIIDSGGGIQAHWMLTEAVDVLEDGEDCLSAMRDLARIFCGDPKVVDLARVMRLPGTVNAKKKHGGEFVAAVLSDTKTEYELDDLCEAFYAARPALENLTKDQDLLTSTQPDNRNVYEIFGDGADDDGERVDVEAKLEGMEPGNIHESQIKVVARLVTDGVDDDEIVERVMDATRAAAGVEGNRWDWRKEERAIRKAIEGAKAKGWGPEARIEKRNETIRQLEAGIVLDDETGEFGDPNWMDDADLTQKGDFRPTFSNLLRLLRKSPTFHRTIALDLLRQQVMVVDLPWGDPGPRQLLDSDNSALREWAEIHLDVRFKKTDIDDCIDLVARENAFDPVAEYLDKCRWDGVERIGSWLIDYMGAEDTPFNRAVGKAWLVGAVKRAYQPGCQMDYMLILEGRQGVGKSTAIQSLCPQLDWFNDSVPGLSGRKENFEAIGGRWIIEVGELASMRKAEVDEAKAFLTSRSDNYRAPYARTVTDNPRRCVFVGTANESSRGHFKDDTGNRRFWFVKVGEVDVDGIRRDRSQIWAEAVQAMKDGAANYLTDRKLASAGEEIAREHSAGASDPWRPVVDRYLTHSPSFDGMGRVAPMGEWSLRSEPLDRVRLEEVLTDALGIEAKNQTGMLISRLTSILVHMGWERRKIRVLGAGRSEGTKWQYAAPRDKGDAAGDQEKEGRGQGNSEGPPKNKQPRF